MGSVAPWRPGPSTLEDVRDPLANETYPTDVLAGCETGLCVFSAAFFGRQDAWYMAKAGMVVDCVDTDAVRLTQMAAVYPDGWHYISEDAFEYAEQASREGVEYDVVSLDPFTNLFDRCAETLPLWCSLATRAVVLGSRETPPDAPEGWRVAQVRKRSDFDGGVYWTVLEPM